MNKINGKFAAAIFATSLVNSLNAQINYNQISGQQINTRVNTITTAVPFLMISPDSRAGGMGDAGVASSADANSVHWNASKLAFAEKKMAIGVSYTPWLRALVPDINLAYLSGYYKTKKNGTFGGSLRYFSLGDITFTDINGNTIGQFRPNEFALDVCYALKLSNVFSMGGAVRYVNSNLTGGTFVDGSATKPGRTLAVDISATYRNEKIKLGGKEGILTFGANISNIGGKMSYSNRNSATNSNFLPINLRLGGSLALNLDDYNSITFLADANKLLVPTPPIYQLDSKGNVIPDGSGGYKIAYGQDPNRGVASGIFGSFSDAPGGAKEELKEINYSLGMEYWYNKLFAIRGGYFYENPLKGNRQYVTLGAGVKYNVFGLDFAYLIPTKQRNPLENTLRFSLTFDFDAFKAQNDDTKTE
jgi:hypothetical protein